MEEPRPLLRRVRAMMRRVLVDIARKRRAERRGGAQAVRVPLEDVEIAADDACGDLVVLDEALERLAVEDPRKARVVELRFFGGLSLEETAEAVGAPCARSRTIGRSPVHGCTVP